MIITDITNAIQGYTSALRKIYPDLDSDEINFISSKVTVTKLKANQLYLMAGDIQESLGFTFEGLLRTFYIDDKGSEITVSFTKENNFATDYGAFINQNPSKYYIETLESCLLVNIPFTLMEECYAKYKNFEKCGRLIAENILNKRQHRIESFLFENAEQRYLNFISQNKDMFNRISLTHLASFLGIKRQTLTRIRKKLIEL